nr:putative GTP diphosphokinase RSH1, chloroplastic [Ipomoea batatas]
MTDEWERESKIGLAFEAHDGQKCCSGEPFTIHPVAVAQILGELELDWESIAAGLLHDTVEDTNVVGTTGKQKISLLIQKMMNGYQYLHNSVEVCFFFLYIL